MKTNFSKIAGAAILACSLATLPLSLPASAQESSPSGSASTAPDNAAASGSAGNMQSQGTDNTRNDHGFDWGWLGLIGLAGLAGLARKKEEPVRYRDPSTAGTVNHRE